MHGLKSKLFTLLFDMITAFLFVSFLHIYFDTMSPGERLAQTSHLMAKIN